MDSSLTGPAMVRSRLTVRSHRDGSCGVRATALDRVRELVDHRGRLPVPTLDPGPAPASPRDHPSAVAIPSHLGLP